MASLGRDAYGASELVALARQLGVSESAVRTSLSRLVVKGFIAPAGAEEGRAAYVFSGKGAAIAANIAAGFEATDWGGWDGEYWGAAWTLPGEDKQGRYRIAKKLAFNRFAPLQPGFWIRPRNPRERMEERLASLMDLPRFTFMAFRPLKPIHADTAALLWDTRPIARAMRKSIIAARKSLARASRMEPEEAFAERYRTGGALVDALFRDPLLPPTFLPADWPADEARDLFNRFDSEMERRSRPFCDGVFKGDRKS